MIKTPISILSITYICFLILSDYQNVLPPIVYVRKGSFVANDKGRLVSVKLCGFVQVEYVWARVWRCLRWQAARRRGSLAKWAAIPTRWEVSHQTPKLYVARNERHLMFCTTRYLYAASFLKYLPIEQLEYPKLRLYVNLGWLSFTQLR